MDIIIKYLKLQMMDLTDLLITHHSTLNDKELNYLISGIISDSSQTYEESNMEDYEEKMDQDSTKHMDEQLSYSTQMASQCLKKPSTLSKTKKISKKYVDESSEEYSKGTRRTKYKKNSGEKPKGYPTKNFLPCFKMPHIDFLHMKLGKDYVDRLELIKRLKKKNGISMSDYQDLYSVEEFSQTFEQFFEKKVLYQQLMTSRATIQVKKIHQSKLHVFERAYRSKEFIRIN